MKRLALSASAVVVLTFLIVPAAIATEQAEAT